MIVIFATVAMQKPDCKFMEAAVVNAPLFAQIQSENNVFSKSRRPTSLLKNNLKQRSNSDHNDQLRKSMDSFDSIRKVKMAAAMQGRQVKRNTYDKGMKHFLK